MKDEHLYGRMVEPRPLAFARSLTLAHNCTVSYAAADALVATPHGEGWGLPMVEAMAMELPLGETMRSRAYSVYVHMRIVGERRNISAKEHMTQTLIDTHTVATNWSGSTAFMSTDNSYGIEVKWTPKTCRLLSHYVVIATIAG